MIEAVKLISKAHREGHRSPETEDAVLLHLARRDEHAPLSRASRDILRKRKELIRDGVLEDTHLLPSDIADGRAGRLLWLFERKQADRVYDGTGRDSWAAAATAIDNYMEDGDPDFSEIEEEFGISEKTLHRLIPRIVGSSAFNECYADDLPVDAYLERVIGYRRVSIGILSERLSSSRMSARRRLRAVESNASEEVETDGFGGVKFWYIQ
ncbi:MAG: hypothetical protein ABEH81_01145 [Halopenitus sp.]